MPIPLMPACRRSLPVSGVGESARRQVKGRVFRCPKCGWTYHRDGVGAMNIRYKYRGEFGVPHVVADMAPAGGIRHLPHTRVACEQSRENVCVGNCTEAAGLYHAECHI